MNTNDLGDRLLLLVVAATALFVLVLGWAAGLVEAELSGWADTLVLSALALLFLAVLVGIWFEFNDIEDEST